MAWELHEGDCLEIMRGMESASFDAIITDPPYSSGGMVRGDRMQGVHTKYIRSGSSNKARLSDFSGDNRDQRAWAYWSCLWLSECLRLTAPGGVCALFTDWRQLPTTADVLQAGGWVWRGIVPWYKPNHRPTQGRWSNACEYLVWGTNGPRALTGSPFPGFFQANFPRERQHITQKPIEVMRQIVRIVPEKGRILDPFAGSGTTLEAALNEGRSAVGIELHPTHCQTIRRRMAAVQAPLPLGEAQ